MLVQNLQDLHDIVAAYSPPPVVKPSIDAAKAPKSGFLSSLFGGGNKSASVLPSNLPKGLYMYGDVGCGKTMLMDMFYETLPPNIKSKTRIHFHNFMQDVHKRLHRLRSQHGYSVDALPFVAAEIASNCSVLCFDEFQCTDIADAMILRRLMELLMHHGCVIVATSNRHPSELYKNGIQRESFIPCINLLQTHLGVLNLNSKTDYRKVPKPAGHVYHHPLDKAAATHEDKWFRFLGDFEHDPPHAAKQKVWGRDVEVPQASGKCAKFTFKELIGRATGAADYIELMRSYNSFIVTDVPGMTYRERDWARRFITFIDAVYESRAKLILTSAVPLSQLFLSPEELDDKTAREVAQTSKGIKSEDTDHSGIDSSMRMLMDDLGLTMEGLKSSNVFSGDEERFAFARALSRLTEMGTQEWVEGGMQLEDSPRPTDESDFAGSAQKSESLQRASA